MAHRILHLGTKWKLVVSFTPRPLNPDEVIHYSYCIEGWVDGRDGLDNMKRRNNLFLLLGIEP
jgi:hypothetical protein